MCRAGRVTDLDTDRVSFTRTWRTMRQHRPRYGGAFPRTWATSSPRAPANPTRHSAATYPRAVKRARHNNSYRDKKTDDGHPPARTAHHQHPHPQPRAACHLS